MLTWLWRSVALVQALLGARVIARLARTARGETIEPPTTAPPSDVVTILVPVLNEHTRLAPCLDGLLTQGPEVREILVVDGGSCDGTQALVASYAERDARLRLVDASPIPDGWNGKAWGLHVGQHAAQSGAPWLLTIDADVRPSAPLTAALLAHATRHNLSALSVATRQDVVGLVAGALHPSMLTTLVYRFGIPGHSYRDARTVQANGQCFLLRRDLLETVGGFAATRQSISEDVTLARLLTRAGAEVGFYEAGALVTTQMYPDWRSTWRGWSRSLPLRDQHFGPFGALGLAEVLLTQAAPLPLYATLRLAGRRTHAPREVLLVNGVLAAARLGVLVGTARAYRRRPWSYWLSPLADAPVAIQLCIQALRRRHVWRGRVLLRGGA